MQQKLQLPKVLLEAPHQSSLAVIERLSCRIFWYFALSKLKAQSDALFWVGFLAPGFEDLYVPKHYHFAVL